MIMLDPIPPLEQHRHHPTPCISRLRSMLVQVVPKMQQRGISMHSRTRSCKCQQMSTAKGNGHTPLAIHTHLHHVTHLYHLPSSKTLLFSKSLEQTAYSSSSTMLRAPTSNTWRQGSLKSKAGAIIKST